MSARDKVRAAEVAQNGRDANRVVPADSEDIVWRNRAEFLIGGEEGRLFRARK